METTVGPEVQWIADFPQAELPCRERDQGWRRGNVALSQEILRSKFWALGGLNQQEILANANVKRATAVTI